MRIGSHFSYLLLLYFSTARSAIHWTKNRLAFSLSNRSSPRKTLEQSDLLFVSPPWLFWDTLFATPLKYIAEMASNGYLKKGKKSLHGGSALFLVLDGEVDQGSPQDQFGLLIVLFAFFEDRLDLGCR